MHSIVFLSFLCFSAHSATRGELHEQAVKKLKVTNFFHDGRGMVITPGVINYKSLGEFIDKIFPSMNGSRFTNRWGLNVIDNEIVGLSKVRYKGEDIGVFGCATCHSGKAAGRYYMGLGNKNIDVGQMGRDGEKFVTLYDKLFGWSKSKTYRKVHKNSLKFVRAVSDERYTTLTQGLVPVAAIRYWFYDDKNLPLPSYFPRSAAKVPHWWGYGKKKKLGPFWDGFADPQKSGFLLGVELTAGQTHAGIRELAKKAEQVEKIIEALLPPKYPYEINKLKAAQGKQLYLISCKKCHGVYKKDAYGYPLYRRTKIVPINEIGTDEDRLEGNTEEFNNLVRTNPLNDVINMNPNYKRGYVAPRLDGIWARFPYLHNGSIPTLYHLLDPNSRPEVFSLKQAGEEHRFDKTAVGLSVPKKGSNEWHRLLEEASQGARDVYDTKRIGHKNIGHDDFNFSEQQKLLLIEYLKTL